MKNVDECDDGAADGDDHVDKTENVVDEHVEEEEEGDGDEEEEGDNGDDDNEEEEEEEEEKGDF